jgi:hypothetical protein
VIEILSYFIFFSFESRSIRYLTNALPPTCEARSTVRDAGPKTSIYNGEFSRENNCNIGPGPSSLKENGRTTKSCDTVTLK